MQRPDYLDGKHSSHPRPRAEKLRPIPPRLNLVFTTYRNLVRDAVSLLNLGGTSLKHQRTSVLDVKSPVPGRHSSKSRSNFIRTSAENSTPAKKLDRSVAGHSPARLEGVGNGRTLVSFSYAATSPFTPTICVALSGGTVSCARIPPSRISHSRVAAFWGISRHSPTSSIVTPKKSAAQRFVGVPGMQLLSSLELLGSSIEI